LKFFTDSAVRAPLKILADQCCGSGIRDGLKVRIRIRDEQPVSYSKSLETIFWIKILKLFDSDPGWKKFGSGIRDKHPGSATLWLAIQTKKR
jgi:hypothetical protein